MHGVEGRGGLRLVLVSNMKLNTTHALFAIFRNHLSFCILSFLRRHVITWPTVQHVVTVLLWSSVCHHIGGDGGGVEVKVESDGDGPCNR